jgi:glucosamine 6-phosphate synthetase-like amidotransferase/phosphosugar isomerase protein
MVVVGTNVDYAVSLYASRVFSLATDKQVTCIPYGEMYLQQKEKSLVALASNIDFYNLIDDKLDYQLKIVSSSVSDLEENTIFYNESIPLLNPILSAVVIQLIAYKKCERG